MQQLHMRVPGKAAAGGGIKLIVQLDRHDPGGHRGEDVDHVAAERAGFNHR